jgi:hypothetical protein
MNAAQRTGPPAVASQIAKTQTPPSTLVVPSVARRGGVRIHLVEGSTPMGESRRRVYLSESSADAKAGDWRRRGWAVTVVRGVLVARSR